MTSFKGMKNAIERTFPGKVSGIAKFHNRNKLSFLSELPLEEIQKHFPQATQSEEQIYHITWE
ncbi:MAG: hypothetical protein A4E49_00304 [Methanosaeta sp. PtaU1.Bin112]|nr:MAG: hypothetical protein A4E49_00304 [Methanosaeta sp. PtaU1.Bin112]